MTSPNNFYEDAHVLLATVPKANKLVVLDAEEGDLCAPLIEALAVVGLCSRSESRSLRRAGDQDDLRDRRLDGPSFRHLQDEAPTAIPQEIVSNKLTRHMEELSSPDDNCTLEMAVSTVFDVLKGARRKHQNWFEDNHAHISKLLARKLGLHKAHIGHYTDANKAAFFRCRRLMQQLLREVKVAWLARNAEEMQEHPHDYKDVKIVHLHKWREKWQPCGSHRAASLLDIVSTVFIRILLNCVNGRL
nr:unnamed protein product [Spirometra erinaceieuropaei]